MKKLELLILGLVLVAAIAAGPIGCSFKAHAEASIVSWPSWGQAEPEPQEEKDAAAKNQ